LKKYDDGGGRVRGRALSKKKANKSQTGRIYSERSAVTPHVLSLFRTVLRAGRLLTLFGSDYVFINICMTGPRARERRHDEACGRVTAFAQ
jgi:hypothetical protein